MKTKEEKKQELLQMLKQLKAEDARDWKAEVCKQGKDCWCREVVRVDPKEDQDYIIPTATISARYAEFLVACHNYLEEVLED